MSATPVLAQPGLRERKKARTRAAIQQHALRLMLAQGYEATTVEQIAAAAEISPSTFFRYFPTKDAAVLQDDLDEVLIEMYKRMPAELGPIAAFRRAYRTAFDALSPEQLELEKKREAMIMTIPELRAKSLDEFARGIRVMTELVASRSGRRPDEPEVRNVAGAMIGVVLGAFFAAMQDPSTDVIHTIDAGLAHLEAGLPL